jgi:hypothetical protein
MTSGNNSNAATIDQAEKVLSLLRIRGETFKRVVPLALMEHLDQESAA